MGSVAGSGRIDEDADYLCETTFDEPFTDLWLHQGRYGRHKGAHKHQDMDFKSPSFEDGRLKSRRDHQQSDGSLEFGVFMNMDPEDGSHRVKYKHQTRIKFRAHQGPEILIDAPFAQDRHLQLHGGHDVVLTLLFVGSAAHLAVIGFPARCGDNTVLTLGEGGGEAGIRTLDIWHNCVSALCLAASAMVT
ncbi:MAG: hypothetical protein Q9186_000594 [Xanthomendoza sp. 1 TL-2023]